MAFYRPQSVRDYLELGRRLWLRRWLIAGVATAVTAIIGVFVMRMPKLYTSSALILIDSGTLDPGRTPTTLNVESRLRNLRPMLTSRTTLETIVKDLNLYPDRRDSEVMDKTIDHMRRYVHVKVSGRDSFEVRFTHPNPKTAQEVGDRLSRMLINRSVSEDLKNARDKVDFLRKQVARLRQESKTQNDKIVQFKSDNADALSQLQGEGFGGTSPIPLLAEQLKSAESSLRAAQDRKIALANSLDRHRGGGAPVVDPAVRDLQQREAKLRQDLDRLLQSYTEQHPDVVKAKAELASAQADLRSAKQAAPKPGVNPQLVNIQREIDQVDGEIKNLRADREKVLQEINDAKARARVNPVLQAQLDELKSELSRINEEMNKVAKDLQQAEFDSQVLESEKGEQFRIQDWANLPQAPDPPGRKILLLVAGLLGLLSGVGVALVRVYFDQTVYNDHELARVTDLPVLVSIPRYVIPGATAPESTLPAPGDGSG